MAIITFQQGVDGYSGASDTMIKGHANYVNNNYGSNTSIEAECYENSSNDIAKILIKFDLSSIPSNATITAVTITLRQGEGSGTDTLTVRRLLRNWIDSQATWNIYSTGNNWATAGAGADTDRSSTESTSLSVDGAVENKIFPSSAQLVADVQGFVDGSLPNYGWIIYDTSNANDYHYHIFNSSEKGTASYRPKITITYTIPSSSSSSSSRSSSSSSCRSSSSSSSSSFSSYSAVAAYNDDFSGYDANYIKIDSCNVTTGWGIWKDTTGFAQNTSNFKEGTGALQINFTPSANNRSNANKTITAIDVSAMNKIAFWVFIESAGHASSFRIRLGLNTSNYFEWSFTDINDGWNYFEGNINSPTTTVGTPNLNNIAYVSLDFYYQTGEANSYWLVDEIWAYKDTTFTNNVWFQPSGSYLYGAHNVHVVSGVYELISNHTSRSGAGNHGRALFRNFTAEDFNADVGMRIFCNNSGWGGRFLFDYQDGFNYTCAYISSQYNKVGVEQYMAGVRSYSEVSFTPAVGTVYSMEIVVRGLNVKVSVDGDLKVSYNLPNARTFGGYGLESFGTTTLTNNIAIGWRNFSVRELSGVLSSSSSSSSCRSSSSSCSSCSSSRSSSSSSCRSSSSSISSSSSSSISSSSSSCRSSSSSSCRSSSSSSSCSSSRSSSSSSCRSSSSSSCRSSSSSSCRSSSSSCSSSRSSSSSSSRSSSSSSSLSSSSSSSVSSSCSSSSSSVSSSSSSSVSSSSSRSSSCSSSSSSVSSSSSSSSLSSSSSSSSAVLKFYYFKGKSRIYPLSVRYSALRTSVVRKALLPGPVSGVSFIRPEMAVVSVISPVIEAVSLLPVREV